MRIRPTLLLLWMLGFTIFLSCHKEEIPSEYKQIIGRWKWVFSCGGYGGVRIDPSTEGYNIELEFKRNGVLKIYKNGKLHERYAFRFEKHQSIYTGQEEYMLVLYPSRLTPKSWYVQGYQSVCFNGTNTLILHDECYDCFSHHYVRIE